jgi:phosphatidylglycerophosphate synthase
VSFEADAAGAKKRDYWWTVLATDPLAIPLSRLLAGRRLLTPDQVTLIALVLGLSVGVFFALGTRWGLVVGGIVFYLAFVFDCVDGKLARALEVTSARGKALDALADGGRRASASLGLFVHFWRTAEIDVIRFVDSGEPFQQFFLDLTRPRELLILLLYVVLAYFFLEISGAPKGELDAGIRGKWSAALARRRLLPNPGMPDVQAVVFILGPITGLVVPALWLGIAMVSVAILLTVWRRLRVPAT